MIPRQQLMLTPLRRFIAHSTGSSQRPILNILHPNNNPTVFRNNSTKSAALNRGNWKWTKRLTGTALLSTTGYLLYKKIKPTDTIANNVQEEKKIEKSIPQIVITKSAKLAANMGSIRVAKVDLTTDKGKPSSAKTLTNFGANKESDVKGDTIDMFDTVKSESASRKDSKVKSKKTQKVLDEREQIQEGTNTDAKMANTEKEPVNNEVKDILLLQSPQKKTSIDNKQKHKSVIEKSAVSMSNIDQKIIANESDVHSVTKSKQMGKNDADQKSPKMKNKQKDANQTEKQQDSIIGDVSQTRSPKHKSKKKEDSPKRKSEKDEVKSLDKEHQRSPKMSNKKDEIKSLDRQHQRSSKMANKKDEVKSLDREQQISPKMKNKKDESIQKKSLKLKQKPEANSLDLVQQKSPKLILKQVEVKDEMLLAEKSQKEKRTSVVENSNNIVQQKSTNAREKNVALEQEKPSKLNSEQDKLNDVNIAHQNSQKTNNTKEMNTENVRQKSKRSKKKKSKNTLAVEENNEPPMQNKSPKVKSKQSSEKDECPMNKKPAQVSQKDERPLKQKPAQSSEKDECPMNQKPAQVSQKDERPLKQKPTQSSQKDECLMKQKDEQPIKQKPAQSLQKDECPMPMKQQPVQTNTAKEDRQRNEQVIPENSTEEKIKVDKEIGEVKVQEQVAKEKIVQEKNVDETQADKPVEQAAGDQIQDMQKSLVADRIPEVCIDNQNMKSMSRSRKLEVVRKPLKTSNFNVMATKKPTEINILNPPRLVKSPIAAIQKPQEQKRNPFISRN